MIDLRYHVISLVAVFLALAIGILLGTTLVARGLIAEQKSEINNLRKTFDQIKEKNSFLNDEIKMCLDYQSQTRTYMLSGRLSGRSYMVISGGGLDDGTINVIEDAVNAAGGIPCGVMALGDRGVFENPNVLDSLSALFQVPPESETVMERTYSELAAQMAYYSNPALIDEFQRIGVIQLSTPINGPVSGAVLFPGNGEDENTVEENAIPLVRSFVGAGFPLLAVGNEETGDEILLKFKHNGISTVDNVQTVPGQVAMVLALEGRGGNYGRGSSADRLIPTPTGM